VFTFNHSDPSLSRQHFRDDRDQKIELGQLGLIDAAEAAVDPELRAYLLDTHRGVRRIGRPLRLATAATLMAAAILGAAPVAYLALTSQLTGAMAVAPLAPGLFMGGLALAVLRGSFGYSGRKVCDVLLSRRLCPACLVILPDDEEPDGCTVCPECGAAWRLGPATPEGTPGAP